MGTWLSSRGPSAFAARIEEAHVRERDDEAEDPVLAGTEAFSLKRLLLTLTALVLLTALAAVSGHVAHYAGDGETTAHPATTAPLPPVR